MDKTCNRVKSVNGSRQLNSMMCVLIPRQIQLKRPSQHFECCDTFGKKVCYGWNNITLYSVNVCQTKCCTWHATPHFTPHRNGRVGYIYIYVIWVSARFCSVRTKNPIKRTQWGKYYACVLDIYTIELSERESDGWRERENEWMKERKSGMSTS